jgi:hypothetical protein
MRRRMLYKVMMVAIACVVLLSISPAPAGAIPPVTGTIGTRTAVKPTSRTARSEAPRDGDGREGRETQGSSVLG